MNTPDVVVIGGGIMGLGIAWRLAQGGAQVTVLERSIPGAEASSAAGGIVAPQMEAERPGPLLDLGLRSRAMYPAFSEELRDLSGVDIGYRASGLILAAFTEDALHAMQATVAWQHACGLRAELLAPKDARTLEPALSPKLLGGIHFADDHQVDNRLLVRALAISAERAGVKFRSGYVREVLTSSGRACGVDIDGERLSADAVVLAAGSWSGLVPGSKVDPLTVKPARGQMIELQLRAPLFDKVLFSSRKGYLVPRTDGRVLAGSTLEFTGFDKQVTAAGLARILEVALEMCPALGDAPVTGHWAGLRPYTEDHLPYLGEGPMPGLFLATGHFRNGILLAPITAIAVAQRVLGSKATVDLAPFRFDRAVPPARAHA